MKTEQITYTTLIADENKLLKRKSDGWIAGEKLTLGYNYYESGVGLSAAKLETPEDYEEIDKPEDWQETPIIDNGKRLYNMLNLLHKEQEDINTYNFTNNEALKVKELYPVWKEDLGEVIQGDKYQCDDLLWEVLQTHTTQANWKPSLQTASLWKVVEEEHEGTESDPIPFTPPMELFNGKYYTQGGAKYKCTRDSQIPLSHNLNELVGIYVELIN